LDGTLNADYRAHGEIIIQCGQRWCVATIRAEWVALWIRKDVTVAVNNPFRNGVAWGARAWVRTRADRSLHAIPFVLRLRIKRETLRFKSEYVRRNIEDGIPKAK
jgi:hypothetical protein